LIALTGVHPSSIPFASEVSLLTDVAEEVVVFGPADMRTAHSDRECIPVNELNETVTILKSSMTAR
jgi:acetylornithine deacetylase